jgi:hypothetical protein
MTRYPLVMPQLLLLEPPPELPLSWQSSFFFFFIPLMSATATAPPSVHGLPWSMEAPYEAIGGREVAWGSIPHVGLARCGYIHFVLIYAGNENF